MALQVNVAAASRRLDYICHRHCLPLDKGRLLALRNPEGYLVVPSVDTAQVLHLGQGTLPEPATIAIVKRILSPGGAMVDVGANLGVFTLVAGRLVGRAGLVIAIEPTRETAKLLRETVRLNGLAEIVEVHEVAAGAAPGEATLYHGATCSYNSLLPLEDSHGMETVQIMTVDQIVGDRPIDLVKIDAEGWESQILDGMSALLSRTPRPSVILEYGPSHLDRACFSGLSLMEQLSNTGLRAYAIDEQNGSLRPFTPGAENTNVLLAEDLDKRLADLLRETSNEQ